MRSSIAYIFIFYFILQCHAKCDCDDNDNVCISQCVIEANSCVTLCRGNIECYESCIDDKWPTQEEDVPDQFYNGILDSANHSSTTVTATVTTTLIPPTISAKISDAAHTSAGNSYYIIPSLTFIYSLFIAFSFLK